MTDLRTTTAVAVRRADLHALWISGRDASPHRPCQPPQPSASWRCLSALALALIATLVVLAFSAAPAFAALTYPFDGRLAPAGGSFGAMNSNGVAVNDSNGDTYVANDPHHESEPEAAVVQMFGASGEPLANLDATLTPAGSFGRGEVAVAANNATGHVYVLDSADGVVDEFDAEGHFVGQITGAATPAKEFNTPEAVAVDQATGEIYVVDQNHGVLDIFSPLRTYARQISLTTAITEEGFEAQFVHSVAVSDFNGHVYLANSQSKHERVYEFDSTGKLLTTWTGSNTPAGSLGESELSVAADSKSGRVYVTDMEHKVTDAFDAAGTYLTQFSHGYRVARGTAVGHASGKVYVSDNAPSPEAQVLDVFGPALTIPDVTTGTATNVLATSATLRGTVTPLGIQLSDCHFDYGTDTTYGQTAACVPAAGTIPPNAGETTVTADVTGLQPGTTYHFRLQAANANGANLTGNDVLLETPPTPVIDSASASDLTATTAKLQAQINPKGSSTTYHFEWGISTAYGNTVPEPDGEIGSGTSDVSRAQGIGPLEENQTYHWRVVAHNANGPTYGSDHTFIYSTASAVLPDNRAYEMVTPPEKNGALLGSAVLVAGSDVSVDGTRVMMSSVQCFGEATSCTAARQFEGEPYAFTRTPGGWVTTPLAPPSIEHDVNSSWLLNADAGTALFSVRTPPGGEDDFYARRLNGLLNGPLVDIGPATAPEFGALGPRFGAQLILTTPDLSHVAYELKDSFWPHDESIRTSSYEFVGAGNTAPRLIGLSAGPGSALISACGTQLGPPNHHGISADGRTVYFTATGNDHGSTICPPGAAAPPVDELYARVDESHSVPISQPNALSPAAPDAGCTTTECLKHIENPAPAVNPSWSDAKIEDVSLDGSKVFFTDTQQLTDAASQDPQETDSATRSGCGSTTGANGCNLYEYDFARTAGHNLVSLSIADTSGLGPRVQRVMAVSADGTHVYFIAQGVLTATPNKQRATPLSGGENLYVFEPDAGHPNGRVAFIATLPTSDAEESANSSLVPNVTPEGRFLVFVSHAALTADDTSTSGAAQVFRYDAETEQLVRISIGDQGFNDNGNTPAGLACETGSCPEDATIAAPTNLARRDPTMSDNGSYVFFRSPVGLTPHALDHVRIGTGEKGSPVYAQNVYEYHDGHVYLISDGKDTTVVAGRGTGVVQSSVELLGSDTSGKNVFFSTGDQLSPQDTDTQRDYYDARICAPTDPCIAPAPAPPPPCLGEACHGTPSAAPQMPVPDSSTYSGAGNITGAAPTPPAKPTAAQLKAKKLASALASCRKKHSKHKRSLCEKAAHKKYGAAAKAKRSAHTNRRAHR
jgi:hypothetical protein